MFCIYFDVLDKQSCPGMAHRSLADVYLKCNSFFSTNLFTVVDKEVLVNPVWQNSRFFVVYSAALSLCQAVIFWLTNS